jgi:hypothetical protein
MSTGPELRTFVITCVHCDKQFVEPLAWLKANPAFRCLHCDSVIEFDHRVIEGVGSVSEKEQALADALMRLGISEAARLPSRRKA